MEIKDIAEKKGKLNKTEKAFLLEQGAKYGVNPPENEACPDCWRDMAVQILAAMNKGKKPRGPHLRGAAATDGVIFKGRLITNPLDAKTLAWMKANGFPKQLLEDDED